MSVSAVLLHLCLSTALALSLVAAPTIPRGYHSRKATVLHRVEERPSFGGKSYRLPDKEGRRMSMHPWPMFGGDSQHTWRAGGGICQGKILWRRKLPDSTGCTPVVSAEGKLYLGVAHQLLEVDASSGKLLRSTPLAGIADSSSPILDDHGRVYIGEADDRMGRFYCVDLREGIRWHTILKGPVVSSPTLGPDGTIYVATNHHWLYALDPWDGHFRWEVQVGGYLSAAGLSPALTGGGMVIVANGDDEEVVAVDANSGVIRWTCAIGASVHGIPSVGPDGTIFIGSWASNDGRVDPHKGFIHAIDGQTGKLKWSHQTSDVVYSGVAIGKDGVIHAGCEDKKVYALDANSGAVRWIFTADAGVGRAPVIGEGGVLYVASAFTLYALDSADGKVRWSRSFGRSGISSNLAVGADGTLYLTLASSFTAGTLCAIR